VGRSQEGLIVRSRTFALVVGSIAALFCGTGSASAQQTGSQAKAQDARWDFVMEERPSLRFGDRLRVDLTGLLDLDWRGMDGEAGDGADFGRRRIGVEGRLFDVLAFEVEGDLGDDHDPWRDVHVEFRKYRALRVRAGHFKIPFGAERLTSIREIEFARRSVVTETLTPARDTGVQLSGRLFGDALGYMAGAFRHDGSTPPRSDEDPWAGGETLAGRVTVAPFAASSVKLLRRIETGAGYTRGDLSEGLNSPVLLVASGFQAFEPVYVSGTRQRAGVDANFVSGSLAFRGEFLRLWDERRGQGLAGDDLPDLVAEGWQLSGAWMAVGDLKSAATPRAPLFRGGIGAIQVAGRFESLTFGSDAPWDEAFRNPRAANVLGNDFRAWTAGLNWYPVRHVKLQLNVLREHLGDPERRPDADASWFTSRVFRVQFSL
jgi:phosphate-selective porin OprO/OprP